MNLNRIKPILVEKIEKYDDRIGLTNPSLLKLPIEQIYQGGELKAHNKRMQNLFRMIGYGENLGSGFSLILNAWNEKHWMKPELVEQPELMQVKLTLHFEDETMYSPKNDPKNDPKSLTKRQKEIISLIHENSGITRDEIASFLNLSESTIKREIATLKAMEILSREGGRYAGHWLVKLQ